MRKNCSSDYWEKLLKFEAEGREFAKILRSLEQFFLTVGQNNFGNKIPFLGQQQTRLSAPVITGKGHLNPDDIFVTVLYWSRYLGDY